MDEIRVGDTVEYCFTSFPCTRQYSGIKGVVVDVVHGNPHNHQPFDGEEYKTRYYVDWEEGSELRRLYNLREFWNFTVRKISVSYDPNQCGDTDDDV